MVFNSIKDIEKDIKKKSRLAIMKAQDEIYVIIKNFVYQYYNSYDPIIYERTYQLLASLVQTQIVSTGNGYTAEVYFDYSSLNYVTGAKPSGLQVMKAAAYGGHGAEGLRIVDGSVGVWDDPKQILDAQAIQILKKNLIEAGIPIK
jgi:hypothetical protein